MGIGCIPCHHPLNLGMLGMHGTEYANFAVTECDLMIAIGARFDDRVTGRIETFAPRAKIIHIDIDPAEIGKNKRVDVPIVGDVKAVLKDLLLLMKKRDAHETWIKKIKHWKQHHPLKCPTNGALHPQFIIRTLSEAGQRQGRDRLGSRAEPDVDCPALLLPQPPVPGSPREVSARWVCTSRGNGSAFCPPGCPGLRYCR